MNYLIQTRQFIGVTAPVFAWSAAGLLILIACVAAIYLTIRVRLLCASCDKASRALNDFRAPSPGTGLSINELEAIKANFEGRRLLSWIWTRIERNFIRRKGASGDEYWLSRTASEFLRPIDIAESQLNREWYETIPGILTGTGLLVTFIAILVALLHVHINGNRVEGMPLLIDGLSGKFVSSIAALFAATLFVVIEKQQFHFLDRAISRLTESVSSVMPVLTSTHLLVELQHDMEEQSVAFRSFNADLSGRLKQSFSESMGPTLERMVGAVENLNQVLRTSEESKSDTITDSLAGMMQRLEQSLTNSLARMGEQFTASLSGNTMDQFSRLSDSFAGAAAVLEQMNHHNQTTQAALTELVTFAKNSAAEQMALGRTQVEDLTNVLRSMLVEIERTTGSSMNSMGTAMTALMSDLSSKVMELTEQTRASMVQASQASTEAAKSILKDAGDWTATSKEQLASLIEKHMAQLDTAERLRASLDGSASQFVAASAQFGTILNKLQQVSADAGVCATAMSGAAKSVKDSQDGLQRVAGLSSLQVEKLSAAGMEQEKLLERMSEAMTHYQQTFSKVESSASALLQTLEQNLAQHLELCKRGYESLAKVSDEHFASATQRLGASVDELSEYLTDLSEVMAARSSGRVGHG